MAGKRSRSRSRSIPRPFKKRRQRSKAKLITAQRDAGVTYMARRNKSGWQRFVRKVQMAYNANLKPKFFRIAYGFDKATLAGNVAYSHFFINSWFGNPADNGSYDVSAIRETVGIETEGLTNATANDAQFYLKSCSMNLEFKNLSVANAEVYVTMYECVCTKDAPYETGLDFDYLPTDFESAPGSTVVPTALSVTDDAVTPFQLPRVTGHFKIQKVTKIRLGQTDGQADTVEYKMGWKGNYKVNNTSVITGNNNVIAKKGLTRLLIVKTAGSIGTGGTRLATNVAMRCTKLYNVSQPSRAPTTLTGVNP